MHCFFHQSHTRFPSFCCRLLLLFLLLRYCCVIAALLLRYCCVVAALLQYKSRRRQARIFLTEVYKVHNPAKLCDVEDILDSYRADYNQMVQDVQVCACVRVFASLLPASACLCLYLSLSLPLYPPLASTSVSASVVLALAC